MQPPVFPVIWARDAANNFPRTPVEMRTLIQEADFRARAWDDVTADPRPALALPQ